MLRMVLLPGIMYCTWNGSDSVVVWGCLLCVARVLSSEWGNLETARGWRWRLPRDKWWPLAVTAGNWVVVRLI